MRAMWSRRIQKEPRDGGSRSSVCDDLDVGNSEMFGKVVWDTINLIAAGATPGVFADAPGQRCRRMPAPRGADGCPPTSSGSALPKDPQDNQQLAQLLVVSRRALEVADENLCRSRSPVSDDLEYDGQNFRSCFFADRAGTLRASHPSCNRTSNPSRFGSMSTASSPCFSASVSASRPAARSACMRSESNSTKHAIISRLSGCRRRPRTVSLTISSESPPLQGLASRCTWKPA